MDLEEDDFSAIYEFNEWAKNTERCEIANAEVAVLLPSFDSRRPLLIAMEKMVRDIALGKDNLGFVVKRDERGKPAVTAQSLGSRYFYQLKAFYNIFAFDQRHVYSVHVSAVCDAINALGMHPLLFTFRSPGSYDRAFSKTDGEVFNEVVAKIKEIVLSRSFIERLRVRTRGAKRNEKKGLAIEQKVFESKSRQLVIMLHLGYQYKYRAMITLKDCQKHRKQFFNNCRSNRLLRGIVDYIWKLEEGDESGLHLHTLLFYTSDACRDVYIAKQIGEYWVKMTGGKGQYWNSNANKVFHEKYGHGVGTGEINWNDTVKREALRKNICYMTKADQFLKIKYPERCHIFGTSEVAEKRKLGRPRNVVHKNGDNSTDYA